MRLDSTEWFMVVMGIVLVSAIALTIPGVVDSHFEWIDQVYKID